MHCSLLRKMTLPFIESVLLHRGDLLGRFDCICIRSVKLPLSPSIESMTNGTPLSLRQFGQ